MPITVRTPIAIRSLSSTLRRRRVPLLAVAVT
jgi:hypothetical protein